MKKSTFVVLHYNEGGKTLRIDNNVIRTKASSEDTSGASSSLEWIIAPEYPGPPMFRFTQHDQSMYVAEGAITLFIGSERHELPAGSFAFVPRGEYHTIMSKYGARVMLTITPGGAEKFFEEVAQKASSQGGLTKDGSVEWLKVADIGSKYGVEFMSHQKSVMPCQ